MSGTGAPKGNQYRKGKKAEKAGRTIGLYLSTSDLLCLEEYLSSQCEEPSQQSVDALARSWFKEMMQNRRSGFLK